MLNGKIILNEGSEEFNKIKQEWYDKARVMKMEDLDGFIKHLTNDYIHDYGTICHAMSIGSIATMWAMNHTDNGGITGFQAGCIMWENIKNWMTEYKDVPLKLVNYNDMLYPQYENKYQKILSDDTFEWLKEQATKNLNEREVAHPDVIAHWETIAAGNVPFGYVLQSVVDAEREAEEQAEQEERQRLIDSGELVVEDPVESDEERPLEECQGLNQKLEASGEILSMQDGVAVMSGLLLADKGEIIEFDDGSSGVCTSEKDVEPKVVVILGDVKNLAVGTFGYATGEIMMDPELRTE